MDQVIFEIMQYTHPKDVVSWFFLNKENYKEYEEIRNKLKSQGRKKLYDAGSDGIYRSWYENGQLEKKHAYKFDSHTLSNQEFGIYQTWYKNGQLSTEYSFETDKIQVEIHYEDNNKFRRVYTYKSKIIRIDRGWVDESGTLKVDTSKYENHRITGLNREWYENGQLKTEIEVYHYNLDHNVFKKRRIVTHGSYRTWYKNGQLSEEAYYNHGKQHNVYRTWHENGQLNFQRYRHYHNVYIPPRPLMMWKSSN